MPLLRLPAAQVVAGTAVPDVCPRHGQPAESRKSLRFVARPSRWSYLWLVVPLVFLILVVRFRRDVLAVGWPWCAECGRARRKRLLVALAVLPVWCAVPFVGSTEWKEAHSDLNVWLWFACTAAYIVLLWRCRAASVAGGRVSRDGQWVEIPDAHEQVPLPR